MKERGHKGGSKRRGHKQAEGQEGTGRGERGTEAGRPSRWVCVSFHGSYSHNLQKLVKPKNIERTLFVAG